MINQLTDLSIGKLPFSPPPEFPPPLLYSDRKYSTFYKKLLKKSTFKGSFTYVSRSAPRPVRYCSALLLAIDRTNSLLLPLNIVSFRSFGQQDDTYTEASDSYGPTTSKIRELSRVADLPSNRSPARKRGTCTKTAGRLLHLRLINKIRYSTSH